MNNLNFISEFQSALTAEFTKIAPFLIKMKAQEGGAEQVRYTLLHHWINTCGIPVSSNPEEIHSEIKGFGILILKDLRSYLNAEQTYAKELLIHMGITPPKKITVPSAIFLASGIHSKTLLSITHRGNTYYAENLEPNDTGFTLKNAIQPESDLSPLKFNIMPDHPIYPMICGHTRKSHVNLEVNVDESPKIKETNADRYIISEHNHTFTKNLFEILNQ
jgi:hypothetical protein